MDFLLPFIEKHAPQPVPPLQDCYGIHERDHGQETWSMIGFVADFQVSGWIGMKKTTWLFHQQRRRFGRKWYFHFDPCFLWKFDSWTSIKIPFNITLGLISIKSLKLFN
jgi:hypothetical protein